MNERQKETLLAAAKRLRLGVEGPCIAEELEALAASMERGEVAKLVAKWHSLGLAGTYGGIADLDVGGVTLRLSYGEAVIVDGILRRVRADLEALAASKPALTSCGHSPYDPCHNCEKVCELCDGLGEYEIDGTIVPCACTQKFPPSRIKEKDNG